MTRARARAREIDPRIILDISLSALADSRQMGKKCRSAAIFARNRDDTRTVNAGIAAGSCGGSKGSHCKRYTEIRSEIMNVTCVKYFANLHISAESTLTWIKFHDNLANRINSLEHTTMSIFQDYHREDILWRRLSLKRRDFN